MRNLAILFLLTTAFGGCGYRQPPAQDALRRDQIAAAVMPSRATAAAVRADEHAIVVGERLGARAGLLRMAVAAVAVVALCLVAASQFPPLAGFLRMLAGGAGVFAGGVLGLRSLLSVPEWIVITVLIAVGLAGLARVLWHAKGLSHLAHELRPTEDQVAKLSGKARRAFARITAWREHHVPKVGP